MSESTRPDPVPVPEAREDEAARAGSGTGMGTGGATEGALVQRRRFLARVSVGLGAVGGLAVTAPLVGFVVAPLGREVPRIWRSVGKVTDFRVGETVIVKFVDASPLPWAGVTANTGRVAPAHQRSRRSRLRHQLRAPRLPRPVAGRASSSCAPATAASTTRTAPSPRARRRIRSRSTSCGIEGDDVEIRTDPIPID
jgi:hypothetical protein